MNNIANSCKSKSKPSAYDKLSRVKGKENDSFQCRSPIRLPTPPTPDQKRQRCHPDQTSYRTKEFTGLTVQMKSETIIQK